MTTKKIDPRKLAQKLLYAETEAEVEKVLRNAGYWNDPKVWRFYGDNENNYSTIGNQQSASDAALVEKIVNSIDSLLMRKSRLAGIEPEGPEAPLSIGAAVDWYFGGNVATWDEKRRFEIGESIYVTVTGNAPKDGQPCFSVVDRGEGICPDDFPETILSLGRSNKLRVPFVQGKFNMGGSGALKFCGNKNLSVIISRRDPALLPKGTRGRDREWGFTVIRREDPSQGRRSSVYTYLAPVGADKYPGVGDVLSFRADTFGLFPAENGDPFGREVEHGTLVKLYEYDTQFKQVAMRSGGMLERIDLMLPKPAVPIRIFEGREQYWANESARMGNLAKTISGLQIRLMDDIKSKSRNNIELEFSGDLTVEGQHMPFTVYVFRPNKAKQYRRSEGVVFTVNGQSHGHFTDVFFRRKSVGMSYLAESLLVFVDCSQLDGRHREDLFLNSRDRLAQSAFRNEIERGLESILASNETLIKLREERRREHNRQRLADTSSLEMAVQSLLESSPSLARIFVQGDRIVLPDEVKANPVEAEKDEPVFAGFAHPTVWRLIGADEEGHMFKDVRKGSPLRLTFETNAANDYFDREKDPGQINLTVMNLDENEEIEVTYTVSIHDGRVKIVVRMPRHMKIGEEYVVRIELQDVKFPMPLVCTVQGVITDPKAETDETDPQDKRTTTRKQTAPKINLPTINRVFRDPENEGDWSWSSMTPEFNKYSALRVVNVEGDRYDFFVNYDNFYVRAEMKTNPDEADVILTRYVYALTLIGLSMLRDDDIQSHRPTEDLGDSVDGLLTIEERIEFFTQRIAPVIIPMIDLAEVQSVAH
jgi:hypothetical protein